MKTKIIILVISALIGSFFIGYYKGYDEGSIDYLEDETFKNWCVDFQGGEVIHLNGGRICEIIKSNE